jgi:hypothetical protein
MNDVQATAERGVLHGTRAVGIPDGVSQRKHRPAKRDLEGTIQHVLHRGVPLREVRPGFVVLERRFIAVHLGKGEELGVGLVLDDIEPMALGLVQDGAGAVCNRGLDEVVDVVLFDCESHHENVRNSLQARSDARLERVTCEDGLPVRRSILDSLG